MKHIPTLVLFVIMIGMPLAHAQDLPEIEFLTWSNRISPGDTYKWTVNKFAFNGTPVSNNSEYGVREGSEITLTVDVQLSEVNVAEYVTSDIELPDVQDYVTVDVDGSETNITIFHPGILILPTNITLAGGTKINALFAANLYDQVFLSAESRLDQENSEYVEYNSSVIQEEFVWDLFLGVLKSVNIHWEGDLELEVAIQNPEQFNTRITTTSSSSTLIESPTRGNNDDSPLSLLIIVNALLILGYTRFKLKN